MKGKRTGIDFSKHEIKEKIMEGCLIHRIAIPGTNCESIKFINCSGILAVTGDYGNWIFCREFIPGEDGVCDYYWTQKLRNSSTQEPGEWDVEGTKRDLMNVIEELKATGDEDGVEYYSTCLNRLSDVMSKDEYLSIAVDNLPDNWDHEYIICRDRLKFWLQAVFDGFDEICRRLKEKEAGNG